MPGDTRYVGLLPASPQASWVLGACLLASALVLAPNVSAADERIQIGGYAGYQIGGSVEGESDVLRREASIQDSISYGGTLDFKLRPGAFAELAYSRQDTEVVVTSPGETPLRHDLTIQYFTIGGLADFGIPNTDRIRPTLGGTIGGVLFQASDAGYDYDEWRLAFLLEGGFKIRLIEHLGLRFRARLLTTFLTDDSALLCGGGGCAYAATGTPLFQGDFSGGAYLAF